MAMARLKDGPLETVGFLQDHRHPARRQPEDAHFAERDRSFRQSVTDAEMLHG